MLRPTLAILTLAAALLVGCTTQTAPAPDPAEVALQATVVAVRAAVAAELGPEPTATPTKIRGGDAENGRALIAAIAGAPTPTPLCTEDLLARLEIYKADGAREGLIKTVFDKLVRSGKPVGQITEWSAKRSGARACTITFQINYANEPLTLTWRYDDTTGHLAAQDALTRFYSGW